MSNNEEKLTDEIGKLDATIQGSLEDYISKLGKNDLPYEPIVKAMMQTIEEANLRES